MFLHTISAYTDQRYNLLKLFEGEVLWAYADTKGIPTIGIGLNLTTHGPLVLGALGFDLGGATLKGAALDAERGYAQQIMAKLNSVGGFVPTANPFTDFNNAVMQALAPILQARAQDPLLISYDPANFTSYDAYTSYELNLISTFQLPSSTVSADLFRQAMDGYTALGIDGNPLPPNPGYEKTLDNWLNITGLVQKQSGLLVHDSKERLVLLSLAFNSRTYKTDQDSTSWNDVGLPTLLGPKLTTALLNDDRAEAWYEIRYDSNSDGTQAKRRFIEADTFGLYNQGVDPSNPSSMTDADALAAFRTYTRHQAAMDAYEIKYAGDLLTAMSSGAQIGTSVQTLASDRQPARGYLISHYADGYDITGNILVGENNGIDFDVVGPIDTADTTYYKSHGDSSLAAYADRDNLIGTNNNDLVFAGSGDDYIDSKGGADVLYGGTGDDTYIIDGRDPLSVNNGSRIEKQKKGDRFIFHCYPRQK